ncbi:MAG: hypothetical protein GX443_02970 [Deltaproteobacteria bacterium]|nr:hypothetical protein [Deltaproteobacteria bacterium]
MNEIFRLQWDLNVHTLAKIGLDYAHTIADPQGKLTWIENYRKALSAELAELVREVQQLGVGTQNGKIELVDMLHFLVSLSHILAVHPEEALPAQDNREEMSFDSLALRIFLALDDLQNSLKWKWWAKGGGFRENSARAAVMDLWKCFHEACWIFGLDFAKVKEIYVAKNRVNFRRQEQGYSEDTKSEDDNRFIRV